MSSFQEIKAWQKSKDLYIALYHDFKELKEFYFKDQILRAALSISNNIAEGYDRNTNKEFARFLFIAKGSGSEVHSMLIIAETLSFIEKSIVAKRIAQITEINKILGGLIKAVNSR